MAEQKTILILEDDPDMRFLLARALQEEGHTTHEAADGDSALADIEKGLRPNLVVMDLSLPNMEPDEFLRLLRARSETKTVPVIVVSGWDDTASRAQALGAASSLRNPVNLSLLYREIDRLLAQAK